MATNTDEYVPNDDDEWIAHAYAEMIHLGSEGMVSHDEAVAEFYAYLAAHDARVRRDAARASLGGLSEAARERIANREITWEHGNIISYAADTYRDTHHPEETP